jgi:hypothetical protein
MSNLITEGLHSAKRYEKLQPSSEKLHLIVIYIFTTSLILLAKVLDPNIFPFGARRSSLSQRPFNGRGSTTAESRL